MEIETMIADDIDIPSPSWVHTIAKEATDSACDAVKNAVGDLTPTIRKRLEIDVRGGMIRVFRLAYSHGHGKAQRDMAIQMIKRLMDENDLVMDDLDDD